MRYFVFGLVLIFIFCVVGCSFRVEDGVGRKYALIYGISDYEEIRDLVFPVNDALEVRDALVRMGYSCILRTNSEAKKENIFDDVRYLSREVSGRDTVIIYFAGHGESRDGVEYIIPWDGRTNFSNFISTEELNKYISEVRSDKVLLIFDYCFSGSFVAKNLGRFVITACDRGEYAFEDNILRHGVFTYFLLKGLESEKSDLDGNGILTLSELFFYVFHNVTNYTKGDQSPRFLGYSSCDMVLR